jgi:hypothetical protein
MVTDAAACPATLRHTTAFRPIRPKLSPVNMSTQHRMGHQARPGLPSMPLSLGKFNLTGLITFFARR